MLTDSQLITKIREKRIQIFPEPDFSIQLGPCSLDLRLGNVFRVFETNRSCRLSTRGSDGLTREVIVNDGEPFVMQPGDFALGTTVEEIWLADDITATLIGRSSIARLGIAVHATAGLVYPGFCGQLTLELQNVNKMAVELYPGDRICALTFEVLQGQVNRPYRGKYQQQVGPVASRIFEDPLIRPSIPTPPERKG
jgi:dCTP deaminase